MIGGYCRRGEEQRAEKWDLTQDRNMEKVSTPHSFDLICYPMNRWQIIDEMDSSPGTGQQKHYQKEPKLPDQQEHMDLTD